MHLCDFLHEAGNYKSDKKYIINIYKYDKNK